jgi:DUF971 family protein
VWSAGFIKGKELKPVIPTPSEPTVPLPSPDRLKNCEGPEEIRVTGKGAGLKLTWPDGQVLSFTAPFLRDNSQSARSKKLKLSGLAVPAAADLTISAVRPIGSYAINIVFSDGYDRAIYPWAYLQDLAQTAQSAPKKSPLTPNDFLKGN